jgi:hypothetical protein
LDQVFKFRQERAFVTHTLFITVKQPNLDPNNFLDYLLGYLLPQALR